MRKIIDKWKEYYVGYKLIRNEEGQWLYDQWFFRFNNNYGASIKRGRFTYGGMNGLYEMACIYYEHEDNDDYRYYFDDDKWVCTRGYLTTENIDELLTTIKRYKTIRGA